VLRIEGDMVPPIAPTVAGRVSRVAVHLLLLDVRPSLIELDLARPMGKMPRARYEALGACSRRIRPWRTMVSKCTPLSRELARTPLRSARCSISARAFSGGSPSPSALP
jgi:hypothetical protein